MSIYKDRGKLAVITACGVEEMDGISALKWTGGPQKNRNIFG